MRAFAIILFLFIFCDYCSFSTFETVFWLSLFNSSIILVVLNFSFFFVIEFQDLSGYVFKNFLLLITFCFAEVTISKFDS